MKIKLIIISANEHRHKYFRRKISSFKNFDIKLCLAEKNKTRHYFKIYQSKNYTKIEKKHFKDRELSEKKYFNNFLKKTPEVKKLKLIERGEFNYNQKLINKIIKIKPDLIISYGCSLIKKPLLTKYKNKFLNVHLGLSPYYKGSGTNFWPFVNNELQFVGVSFLKLDKGIDTGAIIHQMRPNFKTTDTVHNVGNTLIIEMTKKLEKIIINFKNLKSTKQKKYKRERVFLKKQFNENAVKKLHFNLKNKAIKKYLSKKKMIDKKFPIIEQKI
tara:strand:+ start:2369 stop:3184 length:816 start_codon:yes stop_codon:yes gene_type:complete